MDSKRKILIIAAAVIILFLFIKVIQPFWKDNILRNIDKANYCTADDECAAEQFNGFTCGSYLNKNEVKNIYNEIYIYRFLTFDDNRCYTYFLLNAVCKNNKCAPIE